MTSNALKRLLLWSQARSFLAKWRSCATALFVSLVAISPNPSHSQSSIPEGFEALAGPQVTYIDVYFGGNNLGGTLAEYTLDEVTFLEPEFLLDLIPSLTAKDQLLPIVSGVLPTNWRLLCTTDQENCGRLTPDTIGVIFDSKAFRADIFINPDFLSVRSLDDTRYLPPSESGLAMTADITSNFSGSRSDTSDELTHNSQASVVASLGNLRLESMMGYASESHGRFDDLRLINEEEDVRIVGGLLRSVGTSLISESRHYGVRFETTTDLRIDLEQTTATPIQLFFERRSRVEILREEQLLSVEFYEPGNRQLAVGSLPGGAYDITIRVFEGSRLVREETRLFVKSSRFPPRDTTLFLIETGLPVTQDDDLFPIAGDDPLFHAGISRRLADNIAINGDFFASDALASFGTSAIFLGRNTNAEAAFQVSSDNSWSLLAQASFSAGDLGGNGSIRVNRDGDFKPVQAAGGPPVFDPIRNDSVRAILGLSYNIGEVGLAVRVDHTKSVTNGKASEATSINPNLTWPIYNMNSNSIDLSASGNYQQDDQWTAMLRLSARRLEGRWTFRAENSLMADREDTEPFDTTSITASWSDGLLFNDDLNASATYRKVEPDRESLFGDFDYISNRVRLNGTVQHDETNARSTTSYTGRVKTGITVSENGLALTGRAQSGSAILVDLGGDAEGVNFEAVINGRPQGVMATGTKTPLFLPPYKVYRLSIRPLDAQNIRFDGKEQRIALYPGNVVTARWVVETITPVFGQVIDPDGDPIAFARIETEGTTDFTDDYGYFLIEVSTKDEALKLTRRGETLCDLPLPDFDRDQDMVQIDPLVCRPN